MAISTPERVETAGKTPAHGQYTTGAVTSRDGTTIGYRRTGSGPGLLVLHGSMEWSQSHAQLADALASAFTVYLPDRRGRGMSGPYAADYSAQEDVEDIDALLAGTGAHYAFGVSSGAMILLEAALKLTALRKIALYEPPLAVNGSISTDFVSRYDSEIAEGKTRAALVTAMLGTQMGPPLLNAFPRPLLEWLTGMGLKSEDKKAAPGDVTMRKLAPTLHYDFHLVVELSRKLESFSGITNEVLLLGGGKSAPYLKTALDYLERKLPNATRIEFPSLGHGGSGNTNRGGKPDQVALALRVFFLGESA